MVFLQEGQNYADKMRRTLAANLWLFMNLEIVSVVCYNIHRPEKPIFEILLSLFTYAFGTGESSIY